MAVWNIISRRDSNNDDNMHHNPQYWKPKFPGYMLESITEMFNYVVGR